ncbi:carboxylesterase [Alkalihalobacillus alcalophilus ATCC 27647 = CGMCC 1.3604]|uniref:Carboxylesterase n=1 Tax=Alkalihalobacillus alcalophilus ATCC 27647 = CGMCC 1.3604 TaxID=1218173 RepID=A0A094WIG6_ALKAL|nr:alpha/beta fold hydrolase [Alkalihalobacillus alcalophilus]KGA97584.1 carboxylesterase [Alkalihalobacillus alcalophilus ATCC 27647 = CGMCC 1.3604]MED1563370.1 alpha/beta fold hydrolase [Alkalihalobacillus alcalophilus]THG90416.1 carboxylesterase [Alkalihalobacillus alcalophilus ATCC 27647 = CGMCC 1.3604]
MIGCLCLHGFTGEPWEVEPVAKYLFEKKRWLVYTPTLPGHGPNGRLGDVTYTHWILAAEIAVKELLDRCEKVYMIGFSMGGMLACHIAAKYPIEKIVLLSAAAYYWNPSQLLLELKDVIRLQLRGELQKDEHYQLYRAKIVETPMAAVMQFMNAVKAIKPQLKKVKVPTLIVQGEIDGIVPKKSAAYLFETIASENKSLVFLKHSKHMICHDFDQVELIQTVEHFLDKEFPDRPKSPFPK